jgi:hypothetical protein
MMGVREQVGGLVPEMDVFFNAVFVFTSARNEAKWGTTGKANCITDDQLHEYIVENEFNKKKLTSKEVSDIAEALYKLACKDKEFGQTDNLR